MCCCVISTILVLYLCYYYCFALRHLLIQKISELNIIEMNQNQQVSTHFRNIGSCDVSQASLS